MTDDKIFYLHGKPPELVSEPELIETPPESSEAAPKSAVDEYLIKYLKMALEGAEAGRYSGCALMTMQKDGRIARFIGLPTFDDDTSTERHLKSLAFNGGIALLVEDVAFLALQEYPSIEVMLAKKMEQ